MQKHIISDEPFSLKTDPWSCCKEPEDYFTGLRTPYPCPVDNLLGFVRRRGEDLTRKKGREHFHSRWIWTLARRGVAVNVIQGRPLPLHPGEMILIPGNTPHYHQAEPEAELDWCFLTFECTNPAWASGLGGRIFVPAPEESALFHRAAVCMVEGRAAESALWLSLFHESLLRGRVQGREPEDRWLSRIREWAWQVEGAPTIQALAEELGGSESHLRARFREHTGLSLGGYLLHLRMLRAVEALRDPRRSITEIAFDLGYSSPGNFSRAFQREMGTTPKIYRRAHSSK